MAGQYNIRDPVVKKAIKDLEENLTKEFQKIRDDQVKFFNKKIEELEKYNKKHIKEEVKEQIDEVMDDDF